MSDQTLPLATLKAFAENRARQQGMIAPGNEGEATMRRERLRVANATHPTISPDQHFDLMVIAQSYEDSDKEWFRDQARQVVANGWRPAGINF